MAVVFDSMHLWNKLVYIHQKKHGGNSHSAVDLCKIAVRNHLRWLEADTDLEASWAPVDELDGALRLEGGNGCVNILGHNIATVQQAGGHVLAVAWIALDHLVVWLKARHGDLLDRVGLVCGLGSRDDRRVGHEREVDTWVWHKVGLELVQVDVQGAIEAQRSGDRGDDWANVSTVCGALEVLHTLGDQTVQVLVVWALNAQIASANVVDSFVVNHETAVGVLEGGVRGEDGVVGLDHGGGHLWSWVDAELELALLAVVNRQTLHQQRTEARASATAEGVEHQEALEARAAVGDTSDLVQHLVDELLANSVVATGVVVRGVLLASDHLLRVEQAAVGAGADLVDNVWLEIAVDGAGDIFALARLGEEGREALVVVGLVLALFSQVAIGLDAVLEAVQLPARVRDLATCLSHCSAKSQRWPARASQNQITRHDVPLREMTSRMVMFVQRQREDKAGLERETVGWTCLWGVV